MNDDQLFISLGVLICAALSFLMSGMESGVLALSPLRIRQLRRAGNPRAHLLQGYLDNPENFLWTILVGNTIANFAVVGFVTVQLFQHLPGPALLRIGAFLLFVFIYYALLELLPKTLFRLYPNRLCLFLAQPFRFVHIALSPVVAIVAWLARKLARWTGGRTFTGGLFGNRDELRLVMQESAHALTSEEKAMINRVMDLQHLPLRHITIPLAETVTVTANTPMSEVIELAKKKRLSRIPVIQEASGQRKVAGLIHLKPLIYQPSLDTRRLALDLVKPALRLPEDLRLESALRRMQRDGHRLAIVEDRMHRDVGIVSLQDILKTIFGEVSL